MGLPRSVYYHFPKREAAQLVRDRELKELIEMNRAGKTGGRFS